MFAVGSSTSGNTFTGLTAGGFSALSGTSIVRSTAFGYQALGDQFNANSSTDNVAVGYQALYTDFGGNNNVAVGTLSGSSITTGGSNTCLGYGTCFLMNSGSSNVAIGLDALEDAHESTNNVGIGIDTLKYEHNGPSNNNIAIGSWQGAQVGTGGIYNILFGADNINGTNILQSGSYNFMACAGGCSLSSSTSDGQTNIQNIIYGTGNSSHTLWNPSVGQIGIGTSSPFARFAVHANNGDANTTLFAIASSTQTATTTLFSVNNVGDIVTKGAQPSVTGCGTASLTATSTDYRGSINVTAGTPTSCNVTFSSPKSDTPACIVGDNSLTIGADVSAASTTGFAMGIGAAFSGRITYICVQ